MGILPRCSFGPPPPWLCISLRRGSSRFDGSGNPCNIRSQSGNHSRTLCVARVGPRLAVRAWCCARAQAAGPPLAMRIRQCLIIFDFRKWNFEGKIIRVFAQKIFLASAAGLGWVLGQTVLEIRCTCFEARISAKYHFF
jgi:hypothetical protein